MNRRLKENGGDGPFWQEKNLPVETWRSEYTGDCVDSSVSRGQRLRVRQQTCGKGGWSNRSSLPALLQLGLYSMVGGEPVQIFIQRKICLNDKSGRVAWGRVVS